MGGRWLEEVFVALKVRLPIRPPPRMSDDFPSDSGREKIILSREA